MNRSFIRVLVAGVGLILVVNAIALVRVAYNRSGEPESLLRLSQRELSVPRPWGWRTENSGLTLTLQWRVPLADERNVYYGFAGRSAPAAWLDAAKLNELGIRPLQPSATEAEKRRYEKVGPKEVLLVLELDGPAYRAALERTRESAREKADAARNSSAPALKNGADFAQKLLDQEEQSSSRLFVIDAGLDLERLRAKYPNRSQYAIVHGRIHPPRVAGYGQPNAGYVEGLASDQVNVSLEYRPVFDAVPPPAYRLGERYGGPKFEAAVAIGKRLEPWLVSARRQP